jgi:hypothetical protein
MCILKELGPKWRHGERIRTAHAVYSTGKMIVLLFPISDISISWKLSCSLALPTDLCVILMVTKNWRIASELRLVKVRNLLSGIAYRFTTRNASFSLCDPYGELFIRSGAQAVIIIKLVFVMRSCLHYWLFYANRVLQLHCREFMRRGASLRRNQIWENLSWMRYVQKLLAICFPEHPVVSFW